MKQITIYWRDIPSQIILKKGRTKTKKLLSPRFQKAIDRAAMRAGKGGSKAYIEEWRRVTIEIDNAADPSVIVMSEVLAIESRYSDSDLEALIRNKGVAPTALSDHCNT
ncbi:MAG TPA: hypothetical protein EYP91_07850 [Gammaproteobacteria bacterium]|nr:hypothetical protein [Gammaproteobacteria bacterium]